MSGDEAPKTTAVIPVWGRYVGPYLDEALESLRQQGIPLHVIVVDNASDPAPVLGGDIELVRTPSRVTLGAARNYALPLVRTPYVVFWDADDVMLPGTLAFLQAGIAASPALVAFGAAIVEASGQRHRWPRPWIARLSRVPRAMALIDSVWSVYPSTGATIMRTEIVRSSEGYADADSGQDWCLGVSLAFRGRLGWSERPGRIYRRHAGSVWALHMSARHQLAHSAAVRERLRRDPAVPAWVRAALPLIALAQWGAIAASSLVAAARGRRRRRLSG